MTARKRPSLGRRELYLPEAGDHDDVAFLDNERDVGHFAKTRIAAKDLIDPFALDDEFAALPRTRSGDITTRPQVLAHRPGSGVQGDRTVSRDEGCRDRSEDDVGKARDPNLVTSRNLNPDYGDSQNA